MVVVWKTSVGANGAINSEILYAGNSDVVAMRTLNDTCDYLDETGWLMADKFEYTKECGYMYEKMERSMLIRISKK